MRAWVAGIVVAVAVWQLPIAWYLARDAGVLAGLLAIYTVDRIYSRSETH